jgi:hsp70-interacting protein
MSDTQDNDAWLGLLKWSLKYVDGTVPSEESENFKQMSKEDIAFLEDVMKNGIIDEGKRMQTILKELMTYLENILGGNQVDDLQHIETILLELQDIVEQIDFARSFATMGGLTFLVGCACQKTRVPHQIREACLGVLGTMCQNNPPLQLQMLEQGNIPKLLSIYFEEPTNTDSVIKEKVVQAMSCCVRNHDIAETIFCMNEDGKKMIESGLGLGRNERPSTSLKRRSLFFLQALVTSDTADYARVNLFSVAIRFVTSHFMNPEEDYDLREMALSMLCRILEQKKSTDVILTEKHDLVRQGVKRISELRRNDDKEAVNCDSELELWETLITYLARAEPDRENQPSRPLLSM